MELKAHKTGIFGIQGSGKTHWARTMLREFKRPYIIVKNKDDDWDKIPGKKVLTYICSPKRKPKEDFEIFIKHAHWLAEKGLIDLIVIDEADLYFANNYDLGCEEHLDLVLNHRHIPPKVGVALWYLTRRPQDIPTKVVESCKNLVIFKLEGKNAIDRFNDIHPKIPEMIEKLDYKKHEFVSKEIGDEPIINKPIK